MNPNDVLTFAYSRAEAEYRELNEGWRSSDSKAISTATVAGVFLAAAFAFASADKMVMPQATKWLLVALISCLVASVVLAVLAMRVRSIPTPPPAKQVAQMVADVMKICESDATATVDDRLGRLVADMITSWTAVNGRIRTLIDAKNRSVLWSQYLLVVAAALAFILTTVILLC